MNYTLGTFGSMYPLKGVQTSLEVISSILSFRLSKSESECEGMKFA